VKFSHYTNICDSWVGEYHDALVNVPVSLLHKKDRPYEILILGGGSLVPAKNALKYDANVDNVEIDQKLVEYTNSDEYFTKYNENAFGSPRLKVFYQDAYTYLRTNTKKYDLIVMSLPGFSSEKTIQLGSVEFFTFLNKALDDDGVVVTWSYGDVDGEYDYPPNFYLPPVLDTSYLKTFFKDIRDGGFASYAKYYSLVQGNNSASKEYFPADTLYLFQKRVVDRQPDFSSSSYMTDVEPYFRRLNWQTFDHLDFSATRASHIFSPNYEIMTQ
jgi:hypothetical protein